MLSARRASRALLTLAIGLVSVNVSAAPARDEANDPAYGTPPAWASGQNGGVGFQGWNLVGSGDPAADRGFKIGDSRGINADINSPGGLAFGMSAAGQGLAAEAYRSFAAPLAIGDTFSVEIAVNFRSGLRGLDLRAPPSDDERVIFNFNIGADDYVVHKAATGNGSVGAKYDANTAFNLAFTQVGETGGTWTITRRGGVQGRATGTYEGRPAGVKFYVMHTDGGKENELWINRLSIAAGGHP
jgi:hypothetical protein